MGKAPIPAVSQIAYRPLVASAAPKISGAAAGSTRAGAFSEPTVSAVLDAFLVVLELEGLAARQAARRIATAQVQELEAANAACGAAAEQGDLDGFNTANMRFHDLIIAAAQNQLLAT